MRNRPPPSAAPVVLALLLGCYGPDDWSEEADSAALDNVRRAQEAAFGAPGPFTIERPSETFRRRLILNQQLPHAIRASLSTAELRPIDHWPEDDRLSGRGAPSGFLDRLDPASDGPIELTLLEALQLAAESSREYQFRKEEVFRAALGLDLERNAFETQWGAVLTGDLASTLSTEPTRTRTTAIRGTPELSVVQRFQNGISMTGALGFDLIRLLTAPRLRSTGVFADASISIPLLRGAGRFVVAEPMIRAERETLYQVLSFERFKRTFAVRVASEYLAVLQSYDRVQNTEQNYRSLVLSARQLRRLADAGRRDQIQVDQAVQSELQARDSWIRALQTYDRARDDFRVTLGLPPDAAIELDRDELGRLGEAVRHRLDITMEDAERMVAGGKDRDADGESVSADAPIVLPDPGLGRAGPLELGQEEAIELALEHRLDLHVAEGNVYDAQRQVAIRADALGAEATLFGSGSFGSRRTSATSALLPDSTTLRTSDATYGATLEVDLPLQRVAERNDYRNAWIDLERAVRDYQDLEDEVKSEVRDRLRTLLQTREAQRIEAAAVFVAERRVDSARMSLDAGRAQTRDLLEAQEDLVSAQNDLTAALVAYRIAELELQRDTGLLQVGPDGLWTEYVPEERTTDEPRS